MCSVLKTMMGIVLSSPAGWWLTTSTGLFLCVAIGTAGSVHAQPRAPLVVVETALEMPLVEEVSLTGSVVATQMANLSTEVSGVIESLRVEVGDRVRAGDLILTLNSELSKLSLAAARAETHQAIEELADTRRRLEDARRLVKSRSLSVNEVESLAARERIDRAGVERFRAAQKRQEAQLERHTLRAPFDGVVSRKRVERGEWVTPGQPVVELVATDNLQMAFQAPQAIYSRLGNVTGIATTLDALPGRILEASIRAIIPVVDPTTRTFTIRTVLDDTEVRLAPGMSASAVLNLSAGLQGIVVSRDALIRYPDGRITIWIVEQDADQARVREQRVQVGAGFAGKMAITHGLSPGSMVVVRGNEALREGQIVTIKASD